MRAALTPEHGRRKQKGTDMDDPGWHIGRKAFVALLAGFALLTAAGPKWEGTVILLLFILTGWFDHRQRKKADEEDKRWLDEIRKRP
jgi:hypothetical protein